ncbi:conserved hypothetical protein [Paraburkholderia piptadeniae]|uniref:DUF1643 domain-containing protein n=1 Tax=Paraburkholderia piptadeniae TaxID=1701573 RepID=A0A1N7RTZ5_9BURK|nr:DUF1643 domain-containing protein [Paraburkholderia piptadeniae]SIT38591.1 conserved hypothetical protein [Paraburkholderia piptadeniae]
MQYLTDNNLAGERGCILSDCYTYRYLLTRPAESMHPMKSTALFVMLNPSTADGTLDDPTIRRCRGFAKLWDCNGLAVVNLYALRSADPAALWSHPDPVGPDNDDYLWNFARECGDVVCAWGSRAKPDRAVRVACILTDAGARLRCLCMTKDGAPTSPALCAL